MTQGDNLTPTGSSDVFIDEISLGAAKAWLCSQTSQLYPDQKVLISRGLTYCCGASVSIGNLKQVAR